MNNSKTIVIGMSGGVDSSVCAAVLKEQGYNVIGMFMKNWEEKDEHGVCQSSKEYQDVISVCEQLDIPYYSVDFIDEYWENVFTHFLNEYKLGHTPNPDILCNREIKFKVFYQKAIELGADYLATGHYCQIDDQFQLIKGADQGKDQTYFLYTIKTEILKKVVFPIGNLQKSEVREIAKKYNLSTSSKKDSTGICFIGERNFKKFLSNYIPPSQGNFKTLSGEIVGTHSGAAYYTIGQRKGLGLGGQGMPWFVLGKNIESNEVYVERGEKHPALYFDDLIASEITWVTGNEPSLPLKCSCKVRYRQADQLCRIEKITEDKILVKFDTPQRAIATRQSIVFYQGNICLGGAMIESAGKNYLEMNKSVPF